MVFMDCTIMCWNIRGAMNKDGRRHVCELIYRFNPTFFIVMETHSLFSQSKKFWNELGFFEVGISEANGHSGGIWILSMDPTFQCDILDVCSQMVTVKVKYGFREWVCSAVYASLIPLIRGEFWDYVKRLSDDIALPWLLLGDFNEVLLASEVRGGSFCANRARIFSQMLEHCGLLDLGSIGNKFSWTRRVHGGVLVSKRLDRALANCDWRSSFPEAFVETLSRLHSDHASLLIRCGSVQQNRGVRPFRFQAVWSTHPQYEHVVLNAWPRGNHFIPASLCAVRNDSLKFNSEVFGNIHKRKRELEARIRGIEKRLETWDSASLSFLLQQLHKDYDEVLYQEEILWFQKSREKWVRFGDKNTKFFHIQTIVRRKRNKVHGLFLEDGS